MRSLFSDTYSSLFSLMLDKSSSNSSDKATVVLNNFQVITQTLLYTCTLV